LLGANENFIGVRTNDDLVFGTSAIERMRLGYDGNLGIGTAIPHALIHLGNTINNRKIIMWEASNNDHQFYGFGINSSTLRYQVDAITANHIFYAATGTTTSNELMRIQGNGNVGIGTSIPNNRLTIDAGSATVASPNTYQFAIRRSGTTELTLGSDANLTYLQSWNTRPLLINSQGNNVGIGLTTAPAYKLSVNGTIEAVDFGASGSQNIRVGDDVFLTDIDIANSLGIYGIANPAISSLKLGSGGPTLNGLNNTIGGNLGISMSPGNNRVAADGSGNAGTGYATLSVNSFMGYGGSAAYCFGVTGYEWGSTPRSGAVHGAYSSGTWGTLGYTNSASSSYGLYYTNFATGTGYAASGSKRYGIGAGGTGDFMGSWTRGDVIGNINSGELIASYNQGNEITSGKQMEIVNNGTSKTIAYSSTSPDIQVNKAGVGQLINGKASITFNEDFAALIDKSATPVITITPIGDCNGIHIENITSSGFTIAENQHGTSNVSFNYIVIAKRVDADNVSIPQEVLDANFDKNLKDFMFNESDREHVAIPMWWDGEKIRFDAYPADKPSKKENN
jgi:hypothetical protein